MNLQTRHDTSLLRLGLCFKSGRVPFKIFGLRCCIMVQLAFLIFTFGCLLGAALSFLLTVRYFLRAKSREFLDVTRKSSLDEHAEDMYNYLKSLAKTSHVLPCSLDSKFLTAICDYDPSSLSLASLSSFQVVKDRSQCLFAPKSRLWGSQDWNSELDLELNVGHSLKAFIVFASVQLGVDGFLFDIQGPSVGDTVGHFATTVRNVLKFLSDNDPSGYHCMSKSFIGSRGWVFSFCGTEMFVTCLAECYPCNHSRYTFGVEGHAYLLFQPYYSFLANKVGNDTPHTNWTHPKTMRDKIRCNFRKHDREYFIPHHPSFPVALTMVPPISLHGDHIKFWVDQVI